MATNGFISPTTNNHVSVAGNLAADPKVFTYGGDKKKTVFTIAVNDARYPDDKDKTSFIDVEAIGLLGAHVAESLVKGVRVVASGRLNTYVRTLRDEQGAEKKVTIMKVDADFVGPDLTYVSVRIIPQERDGAAQSAPAASAPSAAPAADREMATAGAPSAAPAGPSEPFQF